MAKKKSKKNGSQPTGKRPQFKNLSEAKAYHKANYGSGSKKKSKGLDTPTGNVAGFAGLDSKQKLQNFASMDAKKWAGEKLNKAISGFSKEASRKYAVNPLAKVLTKAMGGGALAGIAGRQIATIFRDPIRSAIYGTIGSFNKMTGGSLDKLNAKAVDFAGKMAHESRQKTLQYGEKAGFLPKGATERYNDPKKQAKFQEQQMRREIRDNTINKDGKHGQQVTDYRKKIAEARKAGNKKEAKRLLKESRAYSQDSKRGILKSGQRVKTSGPRYQVDYGAGGKPFGVSTNASKGYANKAIANIAGTLGVGRRRK